ncbi:hypothetical protein Ancab_011831 [Ancistrocladus abbreviatus]
MVQPVTHNATITATQLRGKPSNHQERRGRGVFSTFMADSSSICNNGSPITCLAQDHLFSILLLLPINSILSFASTCKKFQSFSSSDTLWESICRRDWGQSCVDAIKSSYAATRQQLPSWMEFYQRVTQLDSVSCHKLFDPVGDELVPCPRASHSLNFVSNYLVLFGGGSEGGRHLDDTWVAYIGRDNRTVQRWQKMNSGVPTGRFGHTCVLVGDSLVVFGGINDSGVRRNDTWIGDVRTETFGVTLFWRPLDVGPIAPPPRGAHAGCCISNNRMLVYGGIGLNGLRLGDTWILDLSENLCFGTWHEVVTSPSPPARSGHTLTSIDGKRTVLFGGRGLGYEVLSDVWLFDTSEGHLKWKRVLFDLKNIPRGISLPRVGHSAVPTIGGRVLIYGGEDSIRRRKDDLWLLDVNSNPTIKKHSFSTNSMALLLWRRLKADGYKPNSRSFHAACADHSGRYLYVFGGMLDGPVQPAGSSGLRFDGKLFLVELVLHL